MRTFSGRQALLIAIATSSATLLATFGFAAAMRATESALNPRPLNASPKVAFEQHLTADAAQGRHLFLMNCAHCHGADAHGDEGPDLYNVRKTDERIHQLITNGVKGEMPSFAKKLYDPDIRALTAYLRTLHS
jgi:mono/diheme cytochrome c family protein